NVNFHKNRTSTRNRDDIMPHKTKPRYWHTSNSHNYFDPIGNFNIDEVKYLAKKLSDMTINIGSTLQPNRTEYYLQNTLVLLDLACDGSQLLLLDASEQGYLKSPYRWLILTNGTLDKVLISKLDMPLNSDIVFATNLEQNRVLLTEAYKIKPNSSVIYSTRALWQGANTKSNDNNSSKFTRENFNESSSLKIFDAFEMNGRVILNKHGVIRDYREYKVLSRRRYNLRGHYLTMANVITDSNNTRNHLDDRLFLHQDSITKMSYMVVKICFEMLNATERLLYTNTWGYKDKYPDDFYPRTNEGDRLRRDGRFYGSQVCLQRATASVTAEYIHVALHWSCLDGNFCHPLQLNGSSADVLILIIGAVLQQGCTLEPRYAAGRCVTLLLFVALTILYAAYSANIVVLLRAPSSSKLNDPIRKSIYDKKIAPKGKKPHFYTMKEGGLFAFHMELNPGYRLIQETYQEEEKCDLVEIDYINEIDPWVPGQKRSPYNDLFKINENLLKNDFLYFLFVFHQPDQVNLFKELSYNGVRISASYNSNNLQDHNILFLKDLNCPNAEVHFNEHSLKKKMLWELPLLADSDFVLAERLVNTYQLMHKPSPGGPTYSTPKGFFNGTLVDVRQRRELFWRRRDIMGQPLTMANVVQDRTNCVPNSKRLEIVVFTDSIGPFEVKFIFRQPPLSYVANIFSLPFSYHVWVAIVLSILLSTLSIYIASRIMLLVVFVTLMALYAAYSANIVVLLQAPSTAIRTLDQLVQSGMTLGAIDTDYNRFVFRMFKDPVRTAVFKKVEPNKQDGHYYNLDEGVKRIRQGLFAYHSMLEPVYRLAQETFLETEKCDLMEIDYMYARYPLVPIYKHSPYLELLRVALKRVKESGIQSALHRRHQVPKPKCTDNVSSFNSVGLLNLRPVVYFMLYGIAASVIILMIEIAVHKISADNKSSSGSK
ncbi:unnamed protein product, partial [Leptidea sinapis]